MVLFISLETAARAWAYFKDKKIYNEKAVSKARIPKGASVKLGHMIQLSRHRKIIYELKPNLSVLYRNVLVTTDSQGFRSNEYTSTNTGNRVRILGIGDSVMFGQGVHVAFGYLSVLEHQLNMKYADRKWEAINTAVPGYNAVMEVETLKRKGLLFKPDIVLVGYCVNDLELPQFIRNRTDFSINRSLLLDIVRTRLRILLNRNRETDNWYEFAQAPHASGGGAGVTFEGDPSMVPKEYADMVGWDAYKKAMTELKRLSDEIGFDLVIVNFGNSFHPKSRREEVLELWKDLGLHVVDVDKSMDRYMMEQKMSRYFGSSLTIGEEDKHPSLLSHHIAATTILDYLESHGIVEPFRLH
jgi:hypothetical protein